MPFSFVRGAREGEISDGDDIVGVDVEVEDEYVVKAEEVADSMSEEGLEVTSWSSLGRKVPCFLVEKGLVGLFMAVCRGIL